MGQLQIYNGKLLIVDGKLATSADCCCGETPECFPRCGCCFSEDANVTTGDWPLLELNPAYNWAAVDPFFEDQYWPCIIGIINAARPGTQTFPMFDAGGDSYVKSVTATGDTEIDTTYLGTVDPVTWTFTPTITYRVVFRLWDVDTVCSWGIEVTALIHVHATDGTTVWVDETIEISIDGYLPTPESVQCCGAAGGSTTWGGSVNAGNPVITGAGGQGNIVVSGNKCCRSSEIVGGFYDCAYTGSENCANKDDDALCLPELP